MNGCKQPNSRRNLDSAIERLSVDKGAPLRIRLVIANIVVGQMLPGGVIKGGSSLKLRYGDAGSRFTKDLDAARAKNIERFTSEFEARLATGWNGFTGVLVPGRKAHPKNVPNEYVMQPYAVKLAYNTKSWMTVRFELGHNEIGDADEPDYRISEDIVELFRQLGFPDPQPLPLMSIHHQVAQKLHAATTPGGGRAHDLVDLQLIVANEVLDYSKIARICRRLFAYRNMQEWPPTIVVGEGWQRLYDDQRDGLDVIANVEEAVEWGNGLIRKIVEFGDLCSTDESL